MTNHFTQCELEVMQILWGHGELKPVEIQERYSRPIKNAAVRFQLKVLLGKGHITRRKVGKAYYYRAATGKAGVFKKMTRRMADIYCQGSTVGLIAELIRSEKLSVEDIRDLEELARKEGEFIEDES